MKEFDYLDSERHERERLGKLYSAGGLGASVGIILSLTMLFTGLSLSWLEIILLTLSLGILGVMMGFISS